MSEAMQHLADLVADGKESAPVLAVVTDLSARLDAIESAATAPAVAESEETI